MQRHLSTDKDLHCRAASHWVSPPRQTPAARFGLHGLSWLGPTSFRQGRAPPVPVHGRLPGNHAAAAASLRRRGPGWNKNSSGGCCNCGAQTVRGEQIEVDKVKLHHDDGEGFCVGTCCLAFCSFLSVYIAFLLFLRHIFFPEKPTLQQILRLLPFAACSRGKPHFQAGGRWPLNALCI